MNTSLLVGTSLSAGATDPTTIANCTVVAGMQWADSASNNIWMRDSTNSFWLFQQKIPIPIQADTNFVQDGAMTVGASGNLLNSATGKFIGPKTYVGQTVVIEGAGAAGALFRSTIQAIISPTQIQLAAACSTTVASKRVMWGTINTSALNTAAQAIGSGTGYNATGRNVASKITLPPGFIGVDGGGWNLTNLLGVIIEGQANPADGAGGTTLVSFEDITGGYGGKCHIVDSTGAGFVMIRDIGIGNINMPTKQNTALLFAQTAAGTASIVMMDNVFAVGAFSTACVYALSAVQSKWHRCQFWNQTGGSNTAVTLASDNVNGIQSAYVTIGASQPGAGVNMDMCEIHDQTFNTANMGLRIRGATSVCLFNSSVSSMSNDGAIVFDGTGSGLFSMINGLLYTETGTNPQYGVSNHVAVTNTFWRNLQWITATGKKLNPAYTGVQFGITDGFPIFAKTAGNGTLPSVNYTVYLGCDGQQGTSAFASAMIVSMGSGFIITNLVAQLNGALVAGESMTVNVMVNGVQSASILIPLGVGQSSGTSGAWQECTNQTQICFKVSGAITHAYQISIGLEAGCLGE
jgi:hypothetical protein